MFSSLAHTRYSLYSVTVGSVDYISSKIFNVGPLLQTFLGQPYAGTPPSRKGLMAYGAPKNLVQER